MRILAHLAALTFLLFASCSTSAAPPELGARVHALGEEGLPDDVTCLTIEVIANGTSARNTSTIGRLLNMETGRRESIIRSSELPAYGTPFEIRVEGKHGDDGGCGVSSMPNVHWVGSTGTIRLRAGERRFLDIALYQSGVSEALDRMLSPRFLHSSTALADGRVLIAGGFDSLIAGPCPTSLPEDSECYLAEAAQDAYIFDPPTAQFFEVEGGMLEPRGGHSATLLPDGRVLVAGGANKAVLAFLPNTENEPDLIILPLDDNTLLAHASFELFDSGLLIPSDDPEHRGFPGRGSFKGPAATPMAAGPLNHQRFMHAAVALRNRVLLAGGNGATGAATTFEVFDGARAGGEGVGPESGTLQTARLFPSAAIIRNTVWIIGGANAESNDDLAEVWNGEEPLGSTHPATDETGFLTTARPEFSLFAPQIATDPTTDNVMVIGWHGPRCPRDMPTEPAFSGLDLVRCESTSGNQRNFFISPTGTRVLALPSGYQSSFGAITTDRDGETSAFLTGGFDTGRYLRPSADILRLGLGDRLNRGLFSMQNARALHRSTIIPNGVLSTGGLTATDGNLQLVPLGAEVLTLPFVR